MVLIETITCTNREGPRVVLWTDRATPRPVCPTGPPERYVICSKSIKRNQTGMGSRMLHCKTTLS
jgi:hypothetical protein